MKSVSLCTALQGCDHTYVEQLIEGVVELLDGLVGHPVHTVHPEFAEANRAITCQIETWIRQSSDKSEVDHHIVCRVGIGGKSNESSIIMYTGSSAEICSSIVAKIFCYMGK
jgi:hypothetical protein